MLLVISHQSLLAERRVRRVRKPEACNEAQHAVLTSPCMPSRFSARQNLHRPKHAVTQAVKGNDDTHDSALLGDIERCAERITTESRKSLVA